jgi:hypothetical protein
MYSTHTAAGQAQHALHALGKRAASCRATRGTPAHPATVLLLAPEVSSCYQALHSTQQGTGTASCAPARAAPVWQRLMCGLFELLKADSKHTSMMVARRQVLASFAG